MLVELSQNPNAQDPDRPFGNHDARAVRLLEAARAEIAAAKAYADDPKNWATAAGEPTQFVGGGDLASAQVEAALRASADDLGAPGRDPFYGHGRFNAARALR